MSVENTEPKPSIVESVHLMEERYHSTREQLYEINRQAQVMIQKHPAACIAGAFAVGWVIGKLAKRRWLI